MYSGAVRLAEELVDVSLGHVVVRIVALGLNGPMAPVLALKHEVYPAVRPPLVWVVIPEPNLLDLGGPLWVVLEEPPAENFKDFAVISDFSDALNKLGKGGHTQQ
nr:hypothetical protein [Ruegeria arenilitoris]